MNLHRTMLSCLLLVTGVAFGANGKEFSFVTDSSIPPHVKESYKQSGLAREYIFSTQINPFYIQGDFNGDGRLDCAILVKQKTSGKLGIAIFHSGSRAVHVLGAGRSVGNGGDDFSWMDAWYAYPKGQVHQGADGDPPPRLKGDALMLIKTESASALVYWINTKYRWYQQGD